MSFKERAENRIEQLKTVRDELKVQAHLFGMEIEDEWEGLEKKWNELQQSLSPVETATNEALSEVSTASKLLIEEISNGYDKIKKTL